MPKRRQRRKQRGGNAQELRQLQTGNRNLQMQQKLLRAKPPLQEPGQLYRPRQWGGDRALRDKFGAFLYLPGSYSF